MRDKIAEISEILKEFIQYLGTKQSDPRNRYFALLQVMLKNANRTLVKLHNLDEFFLTCEKNNLIADAAAYVSLNEYKLRIQETIQSCLVHENLEFRVASVSYSSTVLEKCALLERLNQALDKIVIGSNHHSNGPQKHWLSEEWKKIEASLHLETALSMLVETRNKNNLELCQTVLLSEKARAVVNGTTNMTRALNKDFGSTLNQAVGKAEEKKAFVTDVINLLQTKKSKL